jgi:hypothetical protein
MERKQCDDKKVGKCRERWHARRNRNYLNWNYAFNLIVDFVGNRRLIHPHLFSSVNTPM